MNFIIKFKWLILSLVMIPLALSFCSNSDQNEIETAAAKVYDSDPDTLTTAAATGSVTFSIGKFYSGRSYTLQVSADSLSGATGATCVLQYNADMGESDWATLKTITIDGVSTRAIETGTFLRGSLQCKCDAPSSTQSTAIRVDLATE